ncbi:MAG: trypsin-like peptidase domain-containing protein [Candidatus Paceibacterota bacterium]|jgi:serine protease Do
MEIQTELPPVKKQEKPKESFKFVILVAAISVILGSGSGFLISSIYWTRNMDMISAKEPIVTEKTVVQNNYIPQTTEEQKTINLVKDNFDSVVSVIITKDVPIYETYYVDPFGSDWFNFQVPQYRQKGTEKKEVGGGTGFIISSDGMILTNKHVVSEKDAEYTVLTNDGKRYSAKILALDPIYDLAVIKIEATQTKFNPVKLGDSDILQVGQTVVAIGNALAEFQNTVSTGVISGLGRTITAASGTESEVLDDVIQTDAAINAGNSGGPLLNLAGEVIGINVARSNYAENIGFAIPINQAKKAIDQVKASGKIVYPYIGVYYTLITPDLQAENNLEVSYGAWVGRDSSGQKTETVFVAGSPAEKSGLKQDDIILQINGEKITLQNTLSKIVQKYNPKDTISCLVLRNKTQQTIKIILAERI